jgi:Phage endonuclease I
VPLVVKTRRVIPRRMTWTFKRKGNFPTLKPSVRRSKLEDRVESQLQAVDVPYTYEKDKVRYVVPAREAKYIPDFKIGNIYLEVKGTFQRRGASGSVQERQKLILVKEQNPELDIRLVFQNADQPIYKGSKTTLAKWATDNGFPFATGGVVPAEWIREAKQQLAA